MSLLLRSQLNENTYLGIWSITEPESFFMTKVTVQREIAHPQKRLQHLAGRYLLKELLPDFPQEQIAIAATRKPYIPGDAYHFSISHCADKAAVCVSSANRVGVDVERITGKPMALRDKFMHSAEKERYPEWLKQTLAAGNPIMNAEAICHTCIWSAKEAMYKWYGAGKVDFRTHMQLHSWNWHNQSHISINAVFHLPTPMEIKLEGLVIDEDVIMWVVT